MVPSPLLNATRSARVVVKAKNVLLAIASDIRDKPWMLLYRPATVVRTKTRHILRRRDYETFPIAWAVTACCAALAVCATNCFRTATFFFRAKVRVLWMIGSMSL